jgi:tetratricopeptide (TPR) repeat protein
MRKEISLNIQQLISTMESKYEQNKWEAIIIFDKSLKMYPEFSDAKKYKAICYAKLGKKQEEIKALLKRLKLITNRIFN